MPLKHHTETAYMIFLALMICISGWFVALLPHVPLGLPYWGIGFIVAVLYPLVLARTFKANRADYEFRLMHWFPAFIFLIWILFEYIGNLFYTLHILHLGFFFLWSLPLVALGIAFLIIFAVHVLRRSTVRITVLSIFLALFTVGAVYAEGTNLNPKIAAVLFSPQSTLVATTTKGAESLLAYVRSFAFPVAVAPETGSGAARSSIIAGETSSVASSKSAAAIIAAASSSIHMTPPVATLKPHRLPSSGPESIALLFLTLLSLYSIILHTRARSRIEV